MRCGQGDGPAFYCPARAVEVPTVDDAAPGAVATGRYRGLEVRGVLGHGGSGVVYRALDAERGEEVALKTLAAGGFATPAQRTRFRREIAALRALDDPGVIEIYDDGVAVDGTPWLTMRVAGGPSFADLLAESPPIPIAARLRIVEEVARTLGRLHARGIVHRDVKPSNVLLETDGRAVLVDFGLAIGTDDERVTRATRAVGTPGYMAPELASGAPVDGPRVDVFALGRLLADAAGDDGPAALARVVARATAPVPGERHPTATAVADEIARLRAGRGLGLAMWGWEWRRRLRAASAVVVAVVAVAGGVAGVRGAAAVAHWRAEGAATEAWAQARDEALVAWGGGRRDEALARIGRFTAEPAHAGTRAVVAAWLARAELLRAAGDGDGEVAAAEAAFTEASEDETRALARAARVGAYRAHQRWDLLAALVDADPEGAGPAARLALALSRGDIVGALGFADPAESAVLRPLALARPAAVGARTRVAGRDARYGRVDAPTRDGDAWVLPRGATVGADLVAWRGVAGLQIARLDGPALSSVYAGPAGVARAIARVDGRVFVGGGPTERGLHELVDGALVAFDPQVAAYDSRVEGLAGADLDGDGREELIAYFGGPSAFTLRVWRLRPAPEPWATLRVGPSDFLGVAHTPGGARVLVARRPNHPTADPFTGTDAFTGACALISLRGPLTVADERPTASSGPCPRVEGVIADLDGDGWDDAALGLTGADGQPALALHAQGSDGRFGPAVLVGGVTPLASANLDDDVGDELLVVDAAGATWWAGAGDRPVRVVAAPTPGADPGRVPRPEPVADGAVAWSVRGDRGDYLGQLLAAAGDVDDDGYDDVLVGTLLEHGRLYLFPGGARGLAENPTQIWRGSDDAPIWSARGVGDVDGDGVDDLAITTGSPAGPGTLTVRFGSPGGPRRAAHVDGGPGFGVAVAAAGDVDGDGRAEVLVGSQTPFGQADLFRAVGAELVRAQTWRGAPDRRLQAAVGVGDVDGDGRADVGLLFVDADLGGRLQVVGGGEVRLPPGSLPWRAFAVGDVDRDGFDDVVVTTALDAAEAGVARLFRGSSSGLREPPARTWRGEAPMMRMTVGDGVGDTNGDGYADLALGAAGWSRRKGLVRLIQGDGAGGVASFQRTGASQGDLGAAVAGVGDVNGDGFDDWMVAAPLLGPFQGLVQLYTGNADADADADGFADEVDCADHDPASNPSAAEVCDGRDNDCDGLVDDDDPHAVALGPWWVADPDGDGVGEGPPRSACRAPAGFVPFR